MTTPNIEELRLLAQTLEFSDAVRCSIQRAADLLQSQAERIKELELDLDVQAGSIEAVQAANSRLAAERDTLRAELAAIAATEPVLIVEKEPDYWSGGHFHEGSKPHIKPTKVWCLPIGTQLFTCPMPAQDVTELVDALKDVAQTLAWMQHGKCRGFSDGLLTTDEALDKARTALAKYKGAKQ